MSGPKLTVADLRKTYRTVRADGGTPALARVDLEVWEGELVAVVGPSGCGKTTLLHVISGLLAADGGEVRIDGQVVEAPGPDRAVVFQEPALLPWRTVGANVAYGLECLGLGRRLALTRAQPWLEAVGLARFADHYPHELSGGMRQRANLARALAVDPGILLMDEPFASVDALTRETLQEELLALCTRTRKTVLFVTHDVGEAVYLADRVIVLSARPGRVLHALPMPVPRLRTSGDRQAGWYRDCEAQIRALLAPPGLPRSDPTR
jgi:NitT/TauT family transport system ATP-binding protein